MYIIKYIIHRFIREYRAIGEMDASSFESSVIRAGGRIVSIVPLFC